MDYLDPFSEENLANARVYEDFAPTRDRSVKTGCMYSYKDCRRSRPIYDDEKGRLCPFVAAVFGQVRSAEQPVSVQVTPTPEANVSHRSITPV